MSFLSILGGPLDLGWRVQFYDPLPPTTMIYDHKWRVDFGDGRLHGIVS